MILTDEQCEELHEQGLYGGCDIDTVEVQYHHLVEDVGTWYQRLNYWCPFRWWDCGPTMEPLCGSPNLWYWDDLVDRYMGDGSPSPYNLTCEACIEKMKERLK